MPRRLAKLFLASVLVLVPIGLINPATLAEKQAHAEQKPVSEKKTVSLIDQNGDKFKIGTVEFTPTANGQTFSVTMDYTLFSDKFISMISIKCIDGDQTFCHLKYPFKTRNIITNTDLKDLELAFLFVHKTKKEVVINFWNGIYYRLQRQKDGSITGTIWETDMNELATPPEQEYGRLIGGDDLVDGADGKHRFPKIEIK